MITERKSVYSASNGTDRLKKGDVRERERDGRIFLGSREGRTGGGKKECGGSRENMMHSARDVGSKREPLAGNDPRSESPAVTRNRHSKSN